MAETAKPRRGLMLLAMAASLAALAGAQATGEQSSAGATPQIQPEISTRDEKVTFTSHVNLVMVPVVVRDKQGRVVAGLTKDQFRLFDKGKSQEIERFVVERPGALAETPSSPEPAPAGEETPPSPSSAPPASIPRRFIGYLFDDVHAEFGDLALAREAAVRHMFAELKPTDRAAVFTVSGQGGVDFTDDLIHLRQALMSLVPHPIGHSMAGDCPDVSFYQADQIVNYDDPTALQVAEDQVHACMVGGGIISQNILEALARAAAQRALDVRGNETAVALSVVREVVRRMSAAPGDRLLVLVSPGFYSMLRKRQEQSDIIERALQANVVINALNPRGVFTIGFEATGHVPVTPSSPQGIVERQSYFADEEILRDLTAGTGGTYFHDNNDLKAGFRRTATGPEVYYLLGFQPQNLKLDGSFHGLKVALELKAGYTIEARRGYYAPTHLEDAAATAKREIEDAIYSREEMSDLPVKLHTQFFKGAADAATVTVLAHVDLAGARFRKENDRNLDNLTVTSALFDRNGKVVAGAVKHVDLRLRDESLKYRMAQGITVRMALEAAPGEYLVRLVVRESEGQLMSAVNAAVDIP